MLTKQDLKAIGQIFEEKFDIKLKTIKKDIKQIKKDTAYMISTLDREILKDRKRIDNLEKDVKSLKTFA